MMKHLKVRRRKTITVSESVAAKVAEAVARVGLTREEAEAVAAAEPKGATIFAGKLTPDRIRPGKPRARRR